MRKLIAAVTVLATLAFTASSLAVVPRGNLHFAGFTSAPPIAGFKDPMSFSVASNARSVTGFKFGTLGCFGFGGEPPKRNPYAFPTNTAKLAAIPIKGGAFSATQEIKVGPVPTTATVTGKFRRRSGKFTASGAITISQDFQGETCGPATMTYTATSK